MTIRVGIAQNDGRNYKMLLIEGQLPREIITADHLCGNRLKVISTDC